MVVISRTMRLGCVAWCVVCVQGVEVWMWIRLSFFVSSLLFSSTLDPSYAFSKTLLRFLHARTDARPILLSTQNTYPKRKTQKHNNRPQKRWTADVDVDVDDVLWWQDEKKIRFVYIRQVPDSVPIAHNPEER